MQRSLQTWDGEVTVAYLPFLLNPDIPPEGYDFRAYMQAKGGGDVPLEQFFEGPRQMGAAVGLTFNFDKITRAPNSLLAHCLIALTPAEKQDALVEDLYAAYFEHGQDFGDEAVLLELAANHGLNGDQLQNELRSAALREQVQAEVQQAYQLGVTGVPFYVINQKYAFNGAQPPEAIINIFQQIQQKEGDLLV